MHTKGDKVITYRETHDIQKRLNHHTTAWIKMVKLGQQWDHGERFRETCLNRSASVPALSLLIKVHKLIKEGAIPKTRPVCSSTGSMNIHISNLI